MQPEVSFSDGAANGLKTYWYLNLFIFISSKIKENAVEIRVDKSSLAHSQWGNSGDLISQSNISSTSS